MSKINSPGKKKMFDAKTVIVWFFIIIMSFSIGGFLFNGSGDAESISYNGFNIYRQGNIWMTKINGKALPFSYLPSDLEQIDVGPGVKDAFLARSNIFVSFDPNAEELQAIEIARLELREDLANFYNIRVVDAILNASDVYALPKADCRNATGFDNVLVLQQFSQDLNLTPSIMLEGQCIVARGDAREFVMIKDRLMYELAGVMK